MGMHCRTVVVILALCFPVVYTQSQQDVNNTYRIDFETPALQTVGQEFRLVWRHNLTLNSDPLTSFIVRADYPEWSVDFCHVNSDDNKRKTTCKGTLWSQGRCTFVALDDRRQTLEGRSQPFDVLNVGEQIKDSDGELSSTFPGAGSTASSTAAQASSTIGTTSGARKDSEQNADIPLILAITFGVLFSLSLLLILALVYLFVIRPRQRKRELLDNHDFAPVVLAPLSHSTSNIDHHQNHHHYTPPRYSLPLSSIFSKNRTSTEKSMVDGKPGLTTAPVGFNALTERQMNLYDQILQLKHLLISLEDAASPEFQAVMSRIQVLEGLVDSEWAVGRSDVVPDGLEAR